MKTRLFLFSVLVVALASIAMSADPIIGTWKFNLTKSKFAPNGWTAPKEQTEVYRESGPEQIELTFKSTEEKGLVLAKNVAQQADCLR